MDYIVLIYLIKLFSMTFQNYRYEVNTMKKKSSPAIKLNQALDNLIASIDAHSTQTSYLSKQLVEITYREFSNLLKLNPEEIREAYRTTIKYTIETISDLAQQDPEKYYQLNDLKLYIYKKIVELDLSTAATIASEIYDQGISPILNQITINSDAANKDWGWKKKLEMTRKMSGALVFKLLDNADHDAYNDLIQKALIDLAKIYLKNFRDYTNAKNAAISLCEEIIYKHRNTLSNALLKVSFMGIYIKRH